MPPKACLTFGRHIITPTEPIFLTIYEIFKDNLNNLDELIIQINLRAIFRFIIEKRCHNT